MVQRLAHPQFLHQFRCRPLSGYKIDVLYFTQCIMHQIICVKMPTTYNEFQDKQEEFWKAVLVHFEESEITDFRKFFVPLFYLPDDVNVSDSSHPVNLYGADRATSENIDELRTKITSDFPDCPGQLLRYMFEEEDHAIYEALVAMIRTYRDLGNTLRSESSSDSD